MFFLELVKSAFRDNDITLIGQLMLEIDQWISVIRNFFNGNLNENADELNVRSIQN